MCAPVAVTTNNVMIAAGSGIQALLVSQIIALSTVIGVLAFKVIGMVKRAGLRLQGTVGAKLGIKRL